MSSACEEALDLLSDVVLDLVEHGPHDRAWVEREQDGHALFADWLRQLLRRRDARDQALLDRALEHGLESGLLALEGQRYRATVEGRDWAEERGRAEKVELLCADASHAVDAAQLCAELASRGPMTADEAAALLHPTGPFEAIAGIAQEPRRERVAHSIRAAMERGWIKRSAGSLQLTDWGRREADSLLDAWR